MKLLVVTVAVKFRLRNSTFSVVSCAVSFESLPAKFSVLKVFLHR